MYGIYPAALPCPHFPVPQNKVGIRAMPDVVLIAPPIREFYLTKKRTIPYGLACIAKQLEQAGFSCTIIDALAL